MHITRKSMLFAGAAVAGLVLATAASAQTQGGMTKTFNLPAEAAVKGIPDFAAQAGIQIVAPASSLKGLQTQPVQGQIDLHAALAKLIDGTGLEVASDTPTLIVLRMKASEVPNDPQPGATQAAAPAPAGASARQRSRMFCLLSVAYCLLGGARALPPFVGFIMQQSPG